MLDNAAGERKGSNNPNLNLNLNLNFNNRLRGNLRPRPGLMLRQRKGNWSFQRKTNSKPRSHRQVLMHQPRKQPATRITLEDRIGSLGGCKDYVHKTVGKCNSKGIVILQAWLTFRSLHCV
jgi:hypothetical protein